MALFTGLDGDLVSNLVELAESDQCPDAELVIDEARYVLAQDRHVYASFAPGAWPASGDGRTWVSELVCRIGRGRTCATRRSLWARLHFGGSNGEEDDYVLGMRVDGKQNAEWYEEQLSRGLARHTGVCEVWVPPPPPDPRAWWWKHYMEPGLDDGTVSYRTHKTYLDDAVLAAISDFDALPPNGTVFELCAGDGAFAARLLAKFTDVAKYVFVERDADLCRACVDRCASTVVEALCVDACYPALWPSITPPDVIIASGSVLCGSVGPPAAAEPVLRAVATLLKSAGLFVVTGFTQSFIHPALLERHGLEVCRGSVSTDAVGGLSSGFGQFHLLALRKRTVPSPPSLRDALLPRPPEAGVSD
jgi:hypothetical protein